MTRSASNPYAPGYPVSPRLFAGRTSAIETLRRSFEACRDGHLNNVFVEGEWGIGKTSLLDKIRPEFEERGTVVKEDLVASDDQLRDFMIVVFQELLEPSGCSPEDLDVHSRWDRHAIRRSLRVLWNGLAARGHQTAVVMADNLERAQPQFVSAVRDIFQHVGGQGARFMLVFAGRVLPVPRISASDPSARFFQRLPIGPLDSAESVEAIQKPIQVGHAISFSKDAAGLIHDRAQGHPFFLKSICSAVFEIANGRGQIQETWLAKHWPDVEQQLATAKFGDEFRDLPDGEKQTLLRASLLDPEFEAKDLRAVIKTSLDTYLRRLSADRGLLIRLPRHGAYAIYHPLFRAFLQAKARDMRMKPHGHVRVEERRTALGRDEIEKVIRESGARQLSIADQHLRGRAVSFLEAAGPRVRIRVLMGPDPAWRKTKQALDELDLSLRKRIEVREWPASQENPVPWHVRFIVGDREAWETSHSWDGIGRKATYLTRKTSVRDQLLADFERWWDGSKTIFPE